MMTKALKNKTGSAYLITLFIVIFIMTISSLVLEMSRIYNLQESLEYELQRAINISLEIATLDDSRVDKNSHLDIAYVSSVFDDYLKNDMGLNSNNEKIVDDEIMYKVKINNFIKTENPAQLSVEAEVIINNVFSNIVPKTTIPIKVQSKNLRK